MNKEIYNENIDLFLTGKLSKEEAEPIRKKMESDPEFKKLVELHEVALDGINFAAREHLKARLLAQSNTIADHEAYLAAAKKRRNARIIKISSRAAVILLIVTISSIIYLQLKNPEKEIQGIMAHTESLNLSVAGTSDDEILENAEIAFNQKDYETAILHFDDYLDRIAQGESYDILLYKAIALRLTQREEEAKTILVELVEKSHKHFLEDRPRWELALTYLQLGSDQQCLEQLQVIIDNPKSKHSNKAKRLALLVKGRS